MKKLLIFMVVCVMVSLTSLVYAEDGVWIIGDSENTESYLVSLENADGVIVETIEVPYPLSWNVKPYATDGLNIAKIQPVNWWGVGNQIPFEFTKALPGSLTDVRLSRQPLSLQEGP